MKRFPQSSIIMPASSIFAIYLILALTVFHLSCGSDVKAYITGAEGDYQSIPLAPVSGKVPWADDESVGVCASITTGTYGHSPVDRATCEIPSSVEAKRERENETKIDQPHLSTFWDRVNNMIVMKLVGLVASAITLFVILKRLVVLARRAFFVLIHARANSQLRKLESQLITLYSAIKGTERSLVMKGLLMGASIATFGKSKIIQIPYNIYCAAGKRKIKAEFKLTQLKAAEIYYVQGEKYGYVGLHKLPSEQPCCLLLTKPEWESARESFINKLKKAMSKGAFVADSTLKLDGVAEKVSEGLFEIPYDTIKEKLGDKGAELLGFESLDFLLGELYESAVDIILF